MSYPLNHTPTQNELVPKDQALDFSKTRAARKQHDQIVSWAKSQFADAKNARTPTERQWYYNLAFFMGKQHVQFRNTSANLTNALSTRLWVPPAPYFRSRPVINRIRPTIRTELAMLTNNKPTASIVPASADERDMYAALAGEQIWDYLYNENKVKYITRRALWWTLNCGTGFIKTYYDPGKDKICFTPETPFHILVPDLREEEIEDQPFVIHAQLRSPEYAHMYYKQGIDGEEVKINPGGDNNNLIDETYLNLVNSADYQKSRQSVLVLEVWIKPGGVPMFPQGAMFTIVGDKIVQGMGELPYSHGKYPFAKFDHIPTGKFYSASSIEDLIPLQKEYNRTRGQIIEAKNRMAKPQILAPRGSIVANQITTEPGQVIEYTPGFDKPTIMPLAQLPSYVIQELERILNDWNDISGQHEVTHGQVPPGVTAATAISYLQERDETKLSPTFDSLEEGLEKTAFMALNLVKDYWDTPHIIKVVSPDGSFDALAFQGSDLNDNTDIKIESGSSLPTSKAAKQALIMDMMKMGFIDSQQGLQVMDMGGINKIYEQIQVDQRQAQRENLRMSKITPEIIQQAQQIQRQQIMSDPSMLSDPQAAQEALQQPPTIVTVNSWDNHKVHIEYHNRYRKGQAFEGLDDNVKAQFETHVQQHIQAMGLESVSMNPRLAAGLPPIIPGVDDGSDQTQSGGPPVGPGPEPMPGNQLGGP